MTLRSILAGVLLGLLAPSAALADPASFDLAGPTLQVQVTRAGATLPISQTPDLAPGEQLWIKPDLPKSETVHYLLVVTFLRGATNPPPENWFFHAETWTKQGRNGLKMTVPDGAQEALVFLAPQSGGDFKTIVNAVRGRPGAFVRACTGSGPGRAGPVAPRRFPGGGAQARPGRSGPAEDDLAAAGAQPGDQAEHRLLPEDAGSAGGVPDAGPQLAGARRQRRRLDGRAADLRRFRRPRPPAQLRAPGGPGLLQPLCRGRDRHGPHPGFLPHGDLPVHPGALDGAGRPAEAAAQHAAVLPQSDVGAGRRPAPRPARADAAAAARRAQG